MANGRKTIKAFVIIFALVTLVFGGGTSASIAVARDDGRGSFIDEVVREDVARKSMVHVGGFQVGFALRIKGVMIADFNEVDTAAGYATLKSEFKRGDVIKFVNGYEIKGADDIATALSTQIEPTTLIVASRNGKSLTSFVEPLIERVSGALKLGLSVRDEVGGIGTVTYVTQDGRFGALGHTAAGGIAEEDIDGGDVYRCKISGVERGRKGVAGSVVGSVDKSERIGVVKKSNRFGIYGRLDDWAGELVSAQRKSETKTGSAVIKCDLFGGADTYTAEITKLSYQPSVDEKGMIVKITDKRLLDLSGGIIQGMSGSPIVKDGRLVGAITHVFINDPTRGYGIYIDSMLTQTAA